MMKYGERSRKITFTKGQLVLLMVPKPLQKGKTEKYQGPYRVTSKISDLNYEIQSLESDRHGKFWSDVVHVKRLKPFHVPKFYLDYNPKSVESSQDNDQSDDGSNSSQTSDERDSDYAPD